MAFPQSELVSQREAQVLGQEVVEVEAKAPVHLVVGVQTGCETPDWTPTTRHVQTAPRATPSRQGTVGRCQKVHRGRGFYY